MSTPTFDLAIRAYPSEGGYEACRHLQQALDFDRKRSTTFSELVQELVRRIVTREEATGYVHEVPSTGDAPPDLGHTTCTDGEGVVISLAGAETAPPNYCMEQVQKMSDEEAAAARPGFPRGHLHQFPNFYGVPEEAMDQLRSSEAVTVMRTAKTGRAVPKSTSFKQFMWAVPPDAADILEASGQFKRLQPPMTMTCIPKEKS